MNGFYENDGLGDSISCFELYEIVAAKAECEKTTICDSFFLSQNTIF